MTFLFYFRREPSVGKWFCHQGREGSPEDESERDATCGGRIESESKLFGKRETELEVKKVDR